MAKPPRPRHHHDAEGAAWFYEHSSDGFALGRGGRLLSANPAWCAIMGGSIEEFVGGHVLSLVHPDDRQVYCEAVSKYEALGEAEFEHRIRTLDNRTIWVWSKVKRGRDGLTMVVVKDVTAERTQRAEAALAAKSADLLRATAGVFLWMFDPDTGQYTVESVDSPAGAAGGRATEKVSTGQMSDNIHPEDVAGFGAVFLPTVRTGRAGQHVYRYRLVQPDGQIQWARYRTAWLGVRQHASGKWEIRGLTQDITEIAEARDAALKGERAALEANEVKSSFLANMSHDIRTPLNGVLGVLHLLKGEPLSADGRGLIDQALACGGMLTEILNDVLDFSKIEAGRLELNPEPVEVAVALEGVADMLRPAAAAKGLYLRTKVSGAPGWVSVDPIRLRQVLFNLIGNASKFTLDGGIDIELTSIGSGADHRLRVEVKDTGVGVAPDAIGALFERFKQGDSTTTRRFGGAGLGLAITRSLVEQMGGEVGAASALGQGSVFHFEIAAPQVAAPDQARDADTALLEGVRALVVEDNPTNRLIARRILESLGVVVETADDGIEGIAATRRQPFDVIFMDIQMPNMDGVEATRRIRALGGPAAATPIVAMTANVMKHQIAEYLAVGMDGAIAKPLSPTGIVAELTRLATGGETPAQAVA